MCNSEIISMAYELKDRILDSELYKRLKESEKKMLEDEKCSALLQQYQHIKDEYDNAKRFEKYGGNVEFFQKKLSEIKYKVDENEFVKEYNLIFKKMQSELSEIENIIFKDIIKEKRVISL